MITDVQVSWLAGFVDGEGSLLIPMEKNGTLKTIFSVGNTHRISIERVKEIVSEIVGRQIRYYTIHATAKNHQPLFTIRLSKKSEVLAVVKSLLPFLVTKIEQAKLMAQYIESNPATRGQGGLGRPVVLEEHFEMARKMRHLNRRGAAALCVEAPSERLEGQPQVG